MNWESILWKAVETLWVFWWLYAYLEFCRTLRKSDKSNIVVWAIVVCLFAGIAGALSGGDYQHKSAQTVIFIIVLGVIPFFAKPRSEEENP